MRHTAAVLLFIACALALGAPPRDAPVPLRDLKPAFVRSHGPVLRSRTSKRTGLLVAGKPLRGLNAPVPSRIGYDLDSAFGRLRVQVAVLDGTPGPVRFVVIGDGRTLLATPPMLAGEPPLKLDVELPVVLLLELVAEGPPGAHALWIDGELSPIEGRDLGPFRAQEAPFDPGDYPAAFRHRVNDAITRGAAYLMAKQLGSGAFPGTGPPAGSTAIATLALLKARISRDEPQIKRAFAYLRSQPYENTYAVACLLLALEARWFPGGSEDVNAAEERPRMAREVIPEEDRLWMRDAAAWLAGQQGMGFPEADRPLHPVWRYPHGGYDLSCTQYALLGLTAAMRCGIDDRGVWLPALRYLLGAQEREGPKVEVSRYFRMGESMRRRAENAEARGFGYTLNSSPTASMTSAGLCALILCEQALYRSAAYRSGYKEKTRRAIRDSLAWLEEYYEIDENTFGSARWWTYYLYNLERAGVMLDQRYLGTRDWYAEGAEALTALQTPDGAFFGTPVETSLALLFLKRATVPARTIR